MPSLQSTCGVSNAGPDLLWPRAVGSRARQRGEGVAFTGRAASGGGRVCGVLRPRGQTHARGPAGRVFASGEQGLVVVAQAWYMASQQTSREGATGFKEGANPCYGGYGEVGQFRRELEARGKVYVMGLSRAAVGLHHTADLESAPSGW
jgi:hypothetical protein